MVEHSNKEINAGSTLAETFLYVFMTSGLMERIEEIVRDAVTSSFQQSQKPDEGSENPAYLTRSELCQLAHITETTLWCLEKAGVIKKIKFGRKNLYSRLDVEGLLGSGGFQLSSKKKKKKDGAK